MNSQVLTALLIIVAWFAAVPYTARAQVKPADLTPEQRLKLFQASVDDYKVTLPDAKAPAALLSRPLMRFTNEVGTVVDGAVMLWTMGERPVVAAQVFVLADNIWIHEFQSLAEQPLVMTSGETTTWQPKKAGGAWRPFPEPLKVDGTRAGRLRQMKDLAEKFEVAEDFRANASDKDTTRYVLRMLTTPLHRYQETDQGTDGAVFAFVHGTDPEALLTIETAKTGGQLGYRFVLAPLTCWGLQATLNEQSVWSVPEMYGKSAQDQPYHVWTFQPDMTVLEKK